jgi:lysophospholipase L1-like esterase
VAWCRVDEEKKAASDRLIRRTRADNFLVSSILERHPKTAGWVLAAGLSALLLVALEAGVRAIFPKLNFRGIESGLFAPASWPGGYANRRGFSGRVFGVTASIDEHGFRADSTGGRRFDPARDSVLVMGDSVSFGVGVEDGKTFADLLAAAWPDRNVLNAAVIGYGFEDYEAAMPSLLDTQVDPLRAREVILGICLNDGAPSSKAAILAQVSRERGEQPTGESEPPAGGMVARAVTEANAFLRERSKLYLLGKSVFRDAAERYFLADRPFYDNNVAVQRMLARLDNVIGALAERGIPLTVVVFPYAYQLRPGNGARAWLPQKLLLDHLASRGVLSIDLAKALRRDHDATGRPFTAYFLFDDPMHLSAAGHEVAARALLEAQAARNHGAARDS